MPNPIYTRATLRQDIQDMLPGTIDESGTDVLDRIIERAVRDVFDRIDLRSAKRSCQLSLSGRKDTTYEETDGTYELPTILAIGGQLSEYEYHCPEDLKGNRIVDIKKRTDRVGQFRLTTQEEFDRRKLTENYMVAVSDNSWLRKLLVSGVPEIDSETIHDCDALAEDGTFTAVGGASNVATETEDFVEGDGAISFDSDLGSATAGIQNTTFTAVDLSAYEDHDVFVWVYIPEASSITSFTLRWGSDSSNYYEVTVQQTNELTAFAAGWNLLRFNWEDADETGTPDSSEIDFLSFFVNKDVAKAAATGWKVDRIIAMINSGHDVVYYSKYPWRDSSGTYLLKATDDTNLINADADEVNLIILRALHYGSLKLGEEKYLKEYKTDYEDAEARYTSRYPSEALVLTTTEYHLDSLEGEAPLMTSS